MTIGFNAKYFLDVLGALDEDEVAARARRRARSRGGAARGTAAVSRRRDADAHLSAHAPARDRVAERSRLPQPRARRSRARPAASTSSRATTGRARRTCSRPSTCWRRRGASARRKLRELVGTRGETASVRARDSRGGRRARAVASGIRAGLRAVRDRRQAPADARRVRGADADGRVSSGRRRRCRRAPERERRKLLDRVALYRGRRRRSADAEAYGARAAGPPARARDPRRGGAATWTTGRSSWCATASR